LLFPRAKCGDCKPQLPDQHNVKSFRAMASDVSDATI
jgi:hypothetical protein